MARAGLAHQKKAAAKQPAWKQWLKPWRFAALIPLGIAFYFFWSWWVSPEHEIAQFQAAVNSGNTSEMLALASSDEVSHLGLTGQKLSQMIADTAQSSGGIRLVNHYTEPMNPKQLAWNRMVGFDITDQAGHLLARPDGRVARVPVIAYNSPTGWHIGLSKFLTILIFARQGPGHYFYTCQKDGVPPDLFEPADGTWHTIHQPIAP